MKKELVIIGGGFAGTNIAKSLEKSFHVTLIDTKDYFEYTPGILRSIVEPKHLKKIQRLHTNYLHNSQVVIGSVTEVTKKYVLVDGKKIDYDYLVIASGSTYSLPIKEQNVKFASRGSHLRNSYRDLCEAKKVCIIGGGLVGVELAAEIAEHYSGKEINLVHSRENLMNRNAEKSSKYAEYFLKKKGVNLIFNERVKDVKPKKLICQSGKSIDSDLTFVCTGIKPNFDFMKKNFGKYLDERGLVSVNEYLQFEGFSNIFIAGDVAGIREEKTAQNAEKQAHVVVHNLKALQRKEKLCKYESQKRPLVISLGKWKGIYEGETVVLTGFIPAILKLGIEKFIMFGYR